MVNYLQNKRKYPNLLIMIEHKLLYYTIFYQVIKSNFVQN